MNIRDWISNDESVNKEFGPEYRVKEENMNVLGYTWNIKTDTISLKQKPNQLQSEQLTKRV